MEENKDINIALLIDVDNIDTRLHDVAYRLVAKREDSLEQFLIVGIVDLAHL